MISVKPYRLIPFDLGNQMDKISLNLCIDFFTENRNWELLYCKDKSLNEELIAAKYINGIDKDLYMHIYPDGVGIITLIDTTISFNDFNDFNSKQLLEIRRKAHTEILSFKHEISPIVEDNLGILRSFFTNRRESSYITWENGSLSYVMSYYLIDAYVHMIRNNVFQDKIILLLYPCYDEKNAVDYYNQINIPESEIKKNFRKQFLPDVINDFDLLPHIHTCATWANFIIIGKLTQLLESEYWKLERDLQHIWFYTYITEKFIERSLRQLKTLSPENELEKIYDVLTDMTFKVAQYEGIESSIMHEREFRLYKALKSSSRLDILLDNVKRKSELLKDRCFWVLEEKRTKADKRIQFILFILAIITILGTYKEIVSLGAKSILIVVALTIIVSLLLFRPFFSK